jgi:AcrR family transcriptional regulator
VDLKQTRRRGTELETAILDAAWLQLTQAGYSDFTFEAIAARAGTSRTVLYRRWSDRESLMKAAVQHAGMLAPVELPDTGNLRDDVVTLMRRASEARAGLAATLSVQLTEYFRETGTNFSDLRELLIRRGRTGIERVLDRAEERGEVDPSKIPRRVIELPMALMRHELMMTLVQVPEDVIAGIVDDVWMPLLRQYGALS